jgi:hypothetical protein
MDYKTLWGWQNQKLPITGSYGGKRPITGSYGVENQKLPMMRPYGATKPKITDDKTLLGLQHQQ